MSGTSSCSDSSTLGIDESEKEIFDSLKRIAQLPSNPPKEGGQEADSAAGTAGDLVLGEAGKESSAACTGKSL